MRSTARAKPQHIVVEARYALPLNGGVKCYGRSRSVPRGETDKLR